MEAKITSDHSETVFNRLPMPKLVYRMRVGSICNIFDFRTLFHQWNRSSRLEAKTTSDHSETFFNRFLMQKLVRRMKIRSICNIFDFRTLFHQGTDDQAWMKMIMDLIPIQLQGQDKNFDVSHIRVT